MSRTFNVTVFSYVLIIAQYPAMHVIIFDMRAYNWIFLCVLILQLLNKDFSKMYRLYHVLTDKIFVLYNPYFKKKNECNKLFHNYLYNIHILKINKCYPLPDLASERNKSVQ